MMKLSENKGITLIALVITIIVLLILAGISIATLTGTNGILSKASKAKEETIKAEIKEEIELAIAAIQTEEVSKGNKVTLETLAGKDDEDGQLEKSIDLIGITAKFYEDENKVAGEYKGYDYTIDEHLKVVIGDHITGISIEGKLSTTEFTNQDIILEIIATSTNQGKVTVESTEGLIPKDGKYKLKENGTYTFIAKDSTNSTKTIIIKIDNIDKIEPSAEINLSGTSTDTNGSVTATITHTDGQADSKNAQSGINIAKCKWAYNTTSEYIGTDESSYSEKFTGIEQKITLKTTTGGTYYLHVLTLDNAGNKKEMISEAITVEELSLSKRANVGDYVDYKAGTHSYSSKKGTGTAGGNGYNIQTFTSNDNIKWRVLSKENNEVVLISEEPIQTDANQLFMINGAIGYLYAEEELNKICSIYGHGVGANTSKTFSYEVGDVIEGVEKRTLTGSGARSITVEDVNKITGYTPTTPTTSTAKSIYYPTRKTATGYSTSAASRKDKITSYSYTGLDKIATTSNEYTILFRNAENTSDIAYWLASRCVGTYGSNEIRFAMKFCANGKLVNVPVGGGNNSGFKDYSSSRDIRPIVYLKSDIQTTGKDSSGAWTILE